MTQALAGREWLEFPGIGANPSTIRLMEAVALVKRERIDFPAGDGWRFRGGWHQVRSRRGLLLRGRPWEILRDKASIKGRCRSAVC